MASASTSRISKSTLGLRFMQAPAQDAASSETSLADDTRWDVGSKVRDFWRVSDSARNIDQTVASHEESYMPFLFGDTKPGKFSTLPEMKTESSPPKNTTGELTVKGGHSAANRGLIKNGIKKPKKEKLGERQDNETPMGWEPEEEPKQLAQAQQGLSRGALVVQMARDSQKARSAEEQVTAKVETVESDPIASNGRKPTLNFLRPGSQRGGSALKERQQENGSRGNLGMKRKHPKDEPTRKERSQKKIKDEPMQVGL